MSTSHFLSLLFSSLIIISSHAALLVPITKDHSTRQYTLTLSLKTPPQSTKLFVDLGASFSWVDCTNNYTSTTYHSIPCSSLLCDSIHSLACGNCFQPPGPGCANDSCSMFPENSVTRQVLLAGALVDALSLPTTNGHNPSQPAHLPNFIFSCSKTSLLKGLAKGVVGSAALGRSNFSIPAQVSTAFSAPYLFALCLSGSKNGHGVAFFNSAGPYYFLPGVDLSKSLTYTPLILDPIGSTVITYYRHPSDEYYIGVTAIKVNGKDISFNKTILAINLEGGGGGTKISTSTPYTILHSSIYSPLKEAFVRESVALNLTLAKSVKPFDVCYSAKGVTSTRIGPGFPTIDLVMQTNDVFWRIFGSNSMVRIERSDVDLWCLGFLDGGANPRTSIVIGGLQMEDNLLQFDLESKRLGFSSSVLAYGTTCANFNFTTI